jgi:hypothetical protein
MNDFNLSFTTTTAALKSVTGAGIKLTAFYTTEISENAHKSHLQ